MKNYNLLLIKKTQTSVGLIKNLFPIDEAQLYMLSENSIN